MTEFDLAYLAGIIDGEGCITIKVQKKPRQNRLTYEVQIMVANTNLKLMDWLKERFDGNYYTINKKSQRHKTGYLWHFHKNKEEVLKKILPYLVFKNEQAELALKVLEIKKEGYYKREPNNEFSNRLEEVKQKMHVLNKRGKV